MTNKEQEALELISFLKTQDQYKTKGGLRILLKRAADILYKSEKVNTPPTKN